MTSSAPPVPSPSLAAALSGAALSGAAPSGAAPSGAAPPGAARLEGSTVVDGLTVGGLVAPGALSGERLEAELVACAAVVNAAKARFVALLGEFVAREGWVGWGCVSAVQWLSWHCGLGRVAASEHVRVARALGGLPAVAAGFASGALSWSKVRAVTRVAAPHSDALWAYWAATATRAQLDQMVAVARRISADDVERQEAGESLGRRVDERDGSVVYTWRVPAEIAAGVDAAVEAELVPEKGVPVARSRSRALTRLVVGADRPVAEVIHPLDYPCIEAAIISHPRPGHPQDQPGPAVPGSHPDNNVFPAGNRP